MRELPNFWKVIVSIMSVSLVVFQIYTAAFGFYTAIIQRSIHLAFVLGLCFILKPASKKLHQAHVPVYDVILAILAVASCIYMLLIYEDILWDPLKWIGPLDKFFAVAIVFLILEASRRMVGFTFPLLAIIFLVYAYFGPYFPGIWGFRGIPFDIIFQSLYHSTHGVWGGMVGISATMLAMFGIFSAMLGSTGGSKTFVKIAQRLTGKAVGGPGKVAIVSSGLFGMISGSAMANVLASGTFTIPLMKESKFSKEWAAAIEAVASTGGQIMPPIMGAGIFIMAEITGIRYLVIAVAAIIPALLYYLSIFVSVHFLSLRDGLKGKKVDVKVNIKEYIVIIVPIVIFIRFLALGYSVTMCALNATIIGFITYIICVSIGNKSPVDIIKNTVKQSYKISIGGANSILAMASLLAGAQIVIALISMTGFGVKLSDLIISLGGANLFLCLVLTMLVSIILGMGLPTTAAYVLSAAVLAPALTGLGIEILIAHLFVFYFSTMSTITPPVCAAVYMASALARSNWLKTGLLSVMLALPAYIVPYTFMYNQALLLRGSIFQIFMGVSTAILGVTAMGIGIAGFIKIKVPLLIRIFLVISGVMLVIPNLGISLIGFFVYAVFFIQNIVSAKRQNIMTT